MGRAIVKGHTDNVISVAFSPNGKEVATGSRDHTVRVWDTAARTSKVLEGHSGAVTSVSFNLVGSLIASGSDDHTLILWDADGNALGLPLRGDEGGISAISFTPDDQFLVSVGKDGIIRIWPASWKEGLRTACERLRSLGLSQTAGPSSNRDVNLACKEAFSEIKTSSLIKATMRNDANLVRHLLENHVDKEQIDSSGRTPLILASWLEYPEVLDGLLQSGADVNHADSDGDTPLMFAIRSDNLIGAKRLIDAGARLSNRREHLFRGITVLCGASSTTPS